MIKPAKWKCHLRSLKENQSKNENYLTQFQCFGQSSWKSDAKVGGYSHCTINEIKVSSVNVTKLGARI